MPFSLLRYPGGKFYALKKILNFVNDVEHHEYREPFFGGGTVYFNKNVSQNNWINDKYSDLIFFLKFISKQSNRKKLYLILEKLETPNKEKHKEVKEKIPKDDLSRAFKFYYLNRTSFSGKMVNPSWGYRPVRSVHPSRWHEKIEIAASKLKNIKITNYDFEKIINQDNNISTLMYVDPPYFLANQKNHYIESFNDKDHHRLNKVLKDTKHKFILSYDDCDEIRYMYKDFYIHDIDFIYRIENSNPNQNKRKKVNELIITNFKKKNQDSFSFIKEKITLKNVTKM